MKIIIVGLGPGSVEGISLGAWQLLTGNSENSKEDNHKNESLPIYIRTAEHPNIPYLEQAGMRAAQPEYLDYFYDRYSSFDEVYPAIADYLLDQVHIHGTIIYAVPGHPMVAETSVQILLEKAAQHHIQTEIVSSMSFIDVTLAAVRQDPSQGFALLDGAALEVDSLETKQHLLITQIYDDFIASDIKLSLLELYPPEHEVMLVQNAGIPKKELVVNLALEELDRTDFEYDHLTSLFVPALAEHYLKNLGDLIHIVQKLRGPGGCPWDAAQTHESIKGNLVEEAMEARDAIANEDMDNLIEELGDVLLQVVFHSELGREEGYFHLGDVTDGICNKLIYRHPHVFAGLEIHPSQLPDLWEKLKKQEKNQKNIEK